MRISNNYLPIAVIAAFFIGNIDTAKAMKRPSDAVSPEISESNSGGLSHLICPKMLEYYVNTSQKSKAIALMNKMIPYYSPLLVKIYVAKIPAYAAPAQAIKNTMLQQFNSFTNVQENMPPMF